MTRRVGRNFGLRMGRDQSGPDGGSPFAWLDLPPLWLLGFAVLGVALARFLPIWRFGDAFRDPLWTPLGGALIALSLLLAAWAAATLAMSRTSVLPHETPTALVSGGPFAASRNPIYLADLAILTGWAMMLGAITPFLLIVPFAKLLEIRFIRPEEARLEAAFPEQWTAYAARVRRWV